MKSHGMQSKSENMRELSILDQKLEFLVANLAQIRLERQMASLGFNSAPVKCDSSYVETMYVAAIVDTRRMRAELEDRISTRDRDIIIAT